MEVQIKACMRELREVGDVRASNPDNNLTIQSRLQSIRDKYGNDIFKKAEQRLIDISKTR